MKYPLPMRTILILFLTLLFGAAIFGTVQGWEWLESKRLAGAAVIGLLFFAVSIFGFYLEMGEGRLKTAPPQEIFRYFRKKLPKIMLLVVGFPGGAWVLLLIINFLFASWLPDGLLLLLFIIAFAQYVRGVIYLLGWLSEREALD